MHAVDAIDRGAHFEHVRPENVPEGCARVIKQRKSDKASTRDHNRRLILNSLRRAGELSRVDLIEMTGLAGSTVTTVVSELRSDGFIIERDKGMSRGGRRPIFIGIDYPQHQAIGIKVMPDRMEATLTDLAIAPIAGLSAPLLDHAPGTVVDQIAGLTNELLRARGTAPDRLVGVGLALPGFIDSDRGICLDSPRLGWREVHIARLISDRIGYPVWIDNDVNAYAIAHQLFGAAMSKQSLLAVVVGTGLGAALITPGGLHRGWRFRAGEIGYIKDPLPPGTPANTARSWGDQFSEAALALQWAERSQSTGLAGVRLEDALAEALAPAVELLAEFGAALGRRIAVLVGLADPEAIVLGGEMLRYGAPLFDSLIAAFRDVTSADAPEILVDRDNDIWARGAAALAVQSFFATPTS